MTDTAVSNAMSIRSEMAEKIATAQANIREWQARADRAEKFIADWEEFSGQKVQVTQTFPETRTRAAIASAKASNPKKEHVASVARDVLLENGSPMPRDDLFAALKAREIIIQGQNPPVTLQTMMWRMREKIVNIKGFGYWPKDVACPAAGYDPQSHADLLGQVMADTDFSDLLRDNP